MENNYKNFNIGDDVTYLRKYTGVKYKGKVIEIDKDGKYLKVRNTIGNIDYLPIIEVKKMAKGGEVGDYKIGDILKFKDGEDWKVVRVKSNLNKLVIKPYNDKAKNQNVSLEIDIDLDYLKDNLINKMAQGGGVGNSMHEALIKNYSNNIKFEEAQLVGLAKDSLEYKRRTNNIKEYQKEIEKLYRKLKMAKGGKVDNNIVYFTVDNDAADTLLHENFESYIDYENLENGDVLYKMDRRNFERFEDLAYSTSQKYEDVIEEVNSDGSYMMAKGGDIGECTYSIGGL